MTSNLLDLLDFAPRFEGSEPQPLEFDQGIRSTAFPSSCN